VKRVDRTNLALSATTALFAIFALGVLLWLKGRFDRERADTIATVKRQFSVALLGLPDNLKIRFAEIERYHDALIPHNAHVRRILVSKIVAGRGEKIVLPCYYAAVYPDWLNRLRQFERHVLEDQGIAYGAIYFDFDNSRLNLVRGAIASLGVLLLLVLALIVGRLRVQEVALSRTTVELEERKRELVELERLSLAGQLSANILHDIRKPLLNIRMDVEEIEGLPATSDRIQERVGGIRRHVELFFNILRELNIEKFIRGDQAGQEYANVNDLLERACALVRYERGSVEGRTEFTPQLPPVFAFPYRLIQVFSNIILNAYQAMAGQGRLVLKTSREDRWIVVRIADTGPGIRPDHLSRIFEPFFSTKQETGGSGLGLYISKGIVEELGGTVRVSSTPGQGTVFEIRLPAS